MKKLRRSALRALSGTTGILSRLTLFIQAARQREVFSRVDNQRFVFFPYTTAGCLLQHQAFGNYLEGLGSSVAVIDVASRNQILERHLGQTPVVDGDISFPNVTSLLDYLEELVEKSSLLSRGIMDSYMRLSSPDAFGREFRVDAPFVSWAKAQVDVGRELAKGGTDFIFGDGVYLPNIAVLDAAISLGKRCWTLNPLGDFRELKPPEEYRSEIVSIENLRSLVEQEPGLLEKARRYRGLRFSGRDENDLDAMEAFRETKKKSLKKVDGKKILFLHVLRDANDIQLDDQRTAPFRNYLEWTEFALSQISSEPEAWAIRTHPSSKFYAGESEIMENLLRRHNLSSITRADAISTSQILSSGLPVFTHSGTIALEAAASGYRAFSSLKPSLQDFSIQAYSAEQYGAFMRLPYEEASPPLDSERADLACVALLILSERDRFPFSPRLGHPAKSDPLSFRISELKQIVDLLWISLRTHPFEIFGKSAETLFRRSE